MENDFELLAKSKNDKANLSTALRKLREKGATQMESVKVVKRALEISLREADKIVRTSDVWKDKEEATDKLRNTFWDTLDSLD
ncbi:MAG: hypothetical protein AAF960_22490 [Bacteroidota bacterium]